MLPRSFVVIPGTCIGCGLCVGQCPVDAIELVGGKALIDPASCIACGICSMTCPTSAIFSLGSGMHYTVTAVDAEGRLLLVGSI
ncbi:4Fe-4S binding protein [Candidatus Fermentibacterales bacterium]|nr:4Fe-4S binding protein [Candidatus Fermentibacterales bacterium]